jgi:hypothetical protein
VLAYVAAVRLARPRSPWARRFYRSGSRRLARAQRRFPAGKASRWDPVINLFAGRPAPSAREVGATPADPPVSLGPNPSDESAAHR